MSLSQKDSIGTVRWPIALPYLPAVEYYTA